MFEKGPQTVTQLNAAIAASWNEVFNDDYRAALANSMSKRIAEVIRVKGKPTKY